MDTSDLLHYRQTAESIAKGAGELILTYRGKTLKTKSKTNTLDIVTEADLASDAYILGKIHKEFPGHDFLSEESGAGGSHSPFRWIIDPIDGTKEFASGMPLFAVLLALEYNGETIINAVSMPIIQEVYSCAKGLGTSLNGRPVRVSQQTQIKKSMVYVHPPKYNMAEPTVQSIWSMIGRIAKKTYRLQAGPYDVWYLSWIARGSWEAYLLPVDYPKWWDVGTCMLLVQEAGGRVTTLKGLPVTEQNYKTEGILATNSKIHDELLKLIQLDKEVKYGRRV